MPLYGDTVYQGDTINVASYVATVNSSSVFLNNSDPLQTIYNLRVFNYTTTLNTLLPIKIVSKDIIFNVSTVSSNVTTYGDGTARATASFLNGLTKGQGQYIDSSGQLSSFDVLQSTDYNNYTYQITLEKEIAKYRDILLNLLHPTGMKVIGRYALISNSSFYNTEIDVLNQAHTLPYYTGTNGSNVSMSASFSSPSTNVVYFNNLAGANLAGFISNTNILSFTTNYGDKISSKISSVFAPLESEDLLPESGSEDLVLGTGTEDLLTESAFVTLNDSFWLSFANVTTATANANSNTINITSITNSYNVVNNGNYSNTSYPLKDIVRSGDIILVANNTQKTVSSVDYINNRITLTTNLANTVNSFLSVSRTLNAYDGNVLIFGPIGTQYFPQITTQDGISITTQDGKIILLG